MQTAQHVTLIELIVSIRLSKHSIVIHLEPKCRNFKLLLPSRYYALFVILSTVILVPTSKLRAANRQNPKSSLLPGRSRAIEGIALLSLPLPGGFSCSTQEVGATRNKPQFDGEFMLIMLFLRPCHPAPDEVTRRATLS